MRIPRATKGDMADEIAEYIQSKMESGDYPPGALLFSTRKLQKEYKDHKKGKKAPSLQTVRMAFSKLEGKGLIRSTPNNPRAGFKVVRRMHGFIGLICYTPRFDWTGKVIEGVDSRLDEYNNEVSGDHPKFRLIVCLARSSDEESMRIRELVDRVDGLIIVPVRQVRDAAQLDVDFTLLKRKKVRTVILGRGMQSSGGLPQFHYAPLVAYSEDKISAEVAEKVRSLYHSGVRRVFIIGEGAIATLYSRAQKIHYAIEHPPEGRPDLRFHIVQELSKESRAKAGEDAIRQLGIDQIVTGEGKALIIATTDMAALGVIFELQKTLRKNPKFPIRIPDDVLVMGIDGDEVSKTIGLTTLELDPMEVGTTAVNELLRMIRDPRYDAKFDLEEIPVTKGVHAVEPRWSTGEGDCIL